MAEEEARLKVHNLYKIFGPEPERAFQYIEQGVRKDEIFEKTGLTIGVQNANFKVYPNEIFVVMGLSGSGKSTLVRMLNRLIEPTSGEVYVEDKDLCQMSYEDLVQLRRTKMSMVFQSFALMPHLTVEQNAAFGLEIAGHPEDKRLERAHKVLELVGLKANAKSYPQELSGGMQQRVGLARGLAGDPDIMLMDEAFSALDPLIRTEMQDELLKLQEEAPRTIVFISHDLDEAMRIGDRIAMMEGGRIVQIGTPEEILKYPADDYVAAFFRGVDPTHVFSAADIVRDNQITLVQHKGEGPRVALERLQSYDRDFAYVLDTKHRFQGVVSIESLRQIIEQNGDGPEALKQAFLPEVETVSMDTHLQEVLPVITKLGCPVPVVDEDGKYKGAISKNRFLKTLRRDESQSLEQKQQVEELENS
ncbi:MAG: glycine betaine/L-proline ABC transporter ATP-binding protein ProV [Desulfohalobiaceae bacterium]|nr:glycine betaine/L-proline ABC transporter ATP-binding protein ProV [Desulfohalobiaceae bacterium]